MWAVATFPAASMTAVEHQALSGGRGAAPSAWGNSCRLLGGPMAEHETGTKFNGSLTDTEPRKMMPEWSLFYRKQTNKPIPYGSYGKRQIFKP